MEEPKVNLESPTPASPLTSAVSVTWNKEGFNSGPKEAIDTSNNILLLQGETGGTQQFTHVVVDPDVTEIPPKAFEGMTSLISIELPSTLQTIGAYAFHKCTSLERVAITSSSNHMPTISDDLTKSNGGGAVRRDREGPSFYYDSFVTASDGDRPSFVNASLLKSLTFDSLQSNKQRATDRGVVSSKDLMMDDDDDGDNKARPRGSVGEMAFRYCIRLKLIHLPDTIQVLGPSAFESCTSLRHFRFPKYLTDIQRDCFSSCKVLSSISIPRTVTFIGSFAFEGCRKLKLRTPIASSTHIGYGAFGHCTSLDLVKELRRKPSNKTGHRREGPNANVIAARLESGYNLGKPQHPKERDLAKLAQLTINSDRLQIAMCRRISQRGPTALLFVNFYLNLGLVIVFGITAGNYVDTADGQSRRLGNIILFVFAGYDFVKEGLQLWSRQWLYLEDFWNIMDISRISLVLASTIVMELNPNGGLEASESTRTLIAVTGAVIIVSATLFLRTTFLPFAEFVGGLAQIFWTLGPFLVVSFFLMCAFAFMYFTLGNPPDFELDCEQTGNFCTLGNALVLCFNFFFSGPDQTTTWWLDLLFGFVVVVTLLNVLIAIVTDAWGDSTRKAAQLFWSYRIGFLYDVDAKYGGLGNDPDEDDDDGDKLHGGILGNLHPVDSEEDDPFQDDGDDSDDDDDDGWSCLTCLENFFFRILDGKYGNRTFRDQIDWSQHPYKKAARNFDEYMIDWSKLDDMHHDWELTTEDHYKLKQMRSFERDWYWSNQGKITKVRVVFEACVYGILLILGVFTFGLFWPSRFREYIFTHSGDNSRGDSSAEQSMETIRKSLGIPMDSTTTDGDFETVDTKLKRIEANTDVKVRLVFIEEKMTALQQKLETKIASQAEVEQKLDRILEMLEKKKIW